MPPVAQWARSFHGSDPLCSLPTSHLQDTGQGDVAFLALPRGAHTQSANPPTPPAVQSNTRWLSGWFYLLCSGVASLGQPAGTAGHLPGQSQGLTGTKSRGQTVCHECWRALGRARDSSAHSPKAVGAKGSPQMVNPAHLGCQHASVHFPSPPQELAPATHRAVQPTGPRYLLTGKLAMQTHVSRDSWDMPCGGWHGVDSTEETWGGPLGRGATGWAHEGVWLTPA